MKKGKWFQVYYLLALLVIIVNSVFLVIDNLSINIENVPDGVYQYSEFSPDNSTELKVYYIKLPVGNSVRVTETIGGKTRNIFWQTGVDKTDIEWKNDSKVVINGIGLDLKEKEYFDCRSISSIFNDGLMGR